MKLHLPSWLLVVPLAAISVFGQSPSSTEIAASAINSLGVDLLTQGSKADANALTSPYSIQSALAMTFAGAEGDTRAEMARVLHFPPDDAALHASFASLQNSLEEVARSTAEQAARSKKYGGPSDPVILTVANRLFGQQGYDFRSAFLELTKQSYKAPLQPMDFVADPDAARRTINHWVEKQTRERIRDLIPANGLDKETRLVLVNAVYLKAPWAEEFSEHATQPEPFHVGGGKAVDVPTMRRQDRFGYIRRDGHTTLTIPYSGGDVQFLILLPDEINGLPALEARLTADLLTSAARAESRDVLLHLPKFKLQPPLMTLSRVLQPLGMKSAFDQPRGSANFDRMAPRRRDDYLFISEIFHKTFLDLDEKGTEAAAATAVAMMRAAAAPQPKPKPIEVLVDRPFLFAIQHRPSGACLFLGRVTDPR